MTTTPAATATHTDAHLPQYSGSAHRANGWDRVAVGLLGVLGFALSYSALQQMATAAHILQPLSYVYPPLVDGFIAYGVRAVLVLRTAPLPARLYAWMLFGAATSASIWANALHALDLNQPGTTTLHLGNPAVVVLSAIPPLALGGATHLHVLISRYGGAPANSASTVPDARPEVRPQVVDGSDPATGTPAGVLDRPMPEPREQPAGQALAGGHQAAPQAAAVTPKTQQDTDGAAGPQEPPQPAVASSGAGQVLQEGSGPRPQPSQGGRPPKATLNELAEAISAAHPDPDQITRESARKAITATGLGAGHGRLSEAMALARQAAEGRQHPAED
ncbi:DUF2637 domain-containing protein [Streptacidiphilus sp. P02-A3a]|uniref:DUF2637 domain-containing protein n=1 Tax=Streptacidiphilus sp. P02-A3a TaxID=2704468 RepID=UPI0015FA9A65|nr:DUF2637 domain-containing protein [Streptacidiphilus sp. P02-A3a]QMU67101.1 DUF2637 domain-containing protein [Streptacidiphilus sp. P02-A3a]